MHDPTPGTRSGATHADPTQPDTDPTEPDQRQPDRTGTDTADPTNQGRTDPDPPDPTRPDAAAVMRALGHRSGPWPALLAAIDPAGRSLHGRVLRADRGAATVATTAGNRRITWPAGTAAPATGDWVAVSPDDVLQGIAPRRTAITRPAHHKGFRSDDESDQVLAANPDLVGITIPVDGDLHVRRLERGIVMAYESGATPLVLLTKIDLCQDADVVLQQAATSSPGVDVIPLSTTTGQGVEELRARLAPDRTIALLGASGAGKSTLTNALLGHDVLATGAVRTSDSKGRHTTTHRELVPLPSGGAVLDTPGLRTLSLGQIDGGLEAAFPEVEELAAGCRFTDCRHDHEPGCAVLTALDDATLHPDRLEGWRRIRAESENAALRADKARYRQVSRRWGAVGREVQRLKGRDR